RQKPPRGIGDFGDGAGERRLIGLRRLVEAGQLAHELQRRGVNLLLAGRWFEVEQRLDVAAHGSVLCSGARAKILRLDLSCHGMRDYPSLYDITAWGVSMSHVTYRIVQHDGGWAYTVNGVF